jgi:hypothetical protein
MRHFALPIFDDQKRQWGPNKETLEVEDIGDGRLRLLHSPAFVDGLAHGDVIVPREGTPRGYELIERSGRLAIVVVFRMLEHKQGAAGAELRAIAERLGGWCEGGPGRILVLTVPFSGGFAPVEAALNEFAAGVEGCTWWFGNVFDTGTCRPLGWWVEGA